MQRRFSFKQAQFMILLICTIIFTKESVADEPLKVVTFNYPPYEYEENNEIKGIAVEIIQEIFSRMGQPIIIDVLPFSRGIEYIKHKDSDAMFTFYHKKEREEFAYYSKEVVIDQTVALFVHENSSIVYDGDLSKLSQYEFGLVSFSYGKKFDDAVKNKVITLFERVPNAKMNIKKFLERRFEILPSDRIIAYYYYNDLVTQNTENSFPKMKELKPPVQTIPSYVGFAKKEKLIVIRNKLDAILSQMKKDGTYNKIINTTIKKWGTE